MMITKELGKISNVYVGYGGYQDYMIGIEFTLEGKKGWGTNDFKGTWAMEPSEHAEWTKEDQLKILGETMLFIAKLLEEANVRHVEDLKGIPIEAMFDGNLLKSWRILTEVI